MSISIDCISKAAAELGIKTRIYDRHGDFIALLIGSRELLFTKHTVPALSAVEAAVCKDKEYSYLLLKDAVAQPKTIGFLDPSVEPKYERYICERSLEEITDRVETEFSYPLILKRNKGSQGDRVFLVRSRNGLLRRLRTIYNHRSPRYDYIALAQERIKIAREYRVVVVAGQVALVYAKETAGAVYEGNLSPLHWRGSKAVKITDPEILKSIQTFLAPALKKFPLSWAGFDVASDQNNKLWLIEVNARPGFSRYVEHNGTADIEALYRTLLEYLVRAYTRGDNAPLS